MNLQGFPPPYRLGFGDGCATARGTASEGSRRAFGNDGNYRIGLAGRPRAVQEEMTRSRVAR